MIRNIEKILITGGCGFIGTNYVSMALEQGLSILNIDDLKYSANIAQNEIFKHNANYHHEKLDISNFEKIRLLILDYEPDAIVHMAAESHVDNSISNPEKFIETNVFGTFNLLQGVRELILRNPNDDFIFHHVSTDEVFGSLGAKGYFKETTPYSPRSPYSASKAASDHLVRAWGETYNLPYLITNCSNNFGPFQHTEKFIPKVIESCSNQQPIPIYGTGDNVRDWIFVTDHVRILLELLHVAPVKNTFCIGGEMEFTNLELCHLMCDKFDELKTPDRSSRDLIRFVEDRKGHDFRYSIDNSKLTKLLKGFLRTDFDKALSETISWYLKQ